jgi:crossover junction endodeoxyribonuclease RusA
MKQGMILPFPPTLNTMYPTGKNGRRYLSSKGEAFKNDVAIYFAQNRPIKFTGELRVYIELYRPRKIGDIDNFCKPILDSLKGYCFEDDKQVVELHVKRFDDKDNPRVEVVIETREA